MSSNCLPHQVRRVSEKAAEEADVRVVDTAVAVTVERAEMEGGMGWEVLLEMVGTPVQCTEYC